MSALLRQPFALLGAIGLIGMLKSLVTLHEDVMFLVEAYQSVCRPVWDYLFSFIGIELTPFLKDYLTLSAIFGGAMSRAFVDNEKEKDETAIEVFWSIVIGFLGGMIVWPFMTLIYAGHMLFPGEDENDKFTRQAGLFFTSIQWAAVILVASYGLFLYDATKT